MENLHTDYRLQSVKLNQKALPLRLTPLYEGLNGVMAFTAIG